MSLFKSLLFIEESRRPTLDLDETDAFGPTYGNRIANEKAFREPWEHLRQEPIDTIDVQCICVGDG